MTTLVDLVAADEPLPSDAVIFLKRPWSPGAEARVATPSDEDPRLLTKKLRWELESVHRFLEAKAFHAFLEAQLTRTPDASPEELASAVIRFVVEEA